MNALLSRKNKYKCKKKKVFRPEHICPLKNENFGQQKLLFYFSFLSYA